MGLDKDLTTALSSTARSLTLRELRKARIDNVQVIERSQFMQLLEGAKAREAEAARETNKRRMERLLQETEKLGQDKTELEHAKGLVEAERSRLQAALDEIVQELGREAGRKLKPCDVKRLLEELRGLRTENEALREDLAEGMDRSQALEKALERLTVERERLRGERDALEEERTAFRVDLEQFRGERDRFRDERDRFREERDLFRRELGQTAEERDNYLQSCTSLGEERDALRDRLEDLEAARSALKQVERSHEQALERESELARELDKQREALDDRQNMIEALKLELANAKTQQEEAAKELEEKSKQVLEETRRPKPATVEERLRRPKPRGKGPASFGFGFGS